MSRSLSEPSARTWISRASLKVSMVCSSATERTMGSAGRARAMGLRTVTAAPGAAAKLDTSERTNKVAAQRGLTTGAQSSRTRQAPAESRRQPGLAAPQGKPQPNDRRKDFNAEARRKQRTRRNLGRRKRI